MLAQEIANNEAEIQARQARLSAAPTQRMGNDLGNRIRSREVEARNSIDKGRAQVAQDAGKISDDYRSSVRIGRTSRNHGGNRAVWDTVGANASQPNHGTPPFLEPIGEWRIGKDGVPELSPSTNSKPESERQHGKGEPTTTRRTKQ